jgi:hypothetical protein
MVETHVGQVPLGHLWVEVPAPDQLRLTFEDPDLARGTRQANMLTEPPRGCATS